MTEQPPLGWGPRPQPPAGQTPTRPLNLGPGNPTQPGNPTNPLSPFHQQTTQATPPQQTAPLQQTTLAAPPGSRSSGSGRLIAVAAVVSLIVGGAAGYGGAVLAGNSGAGSNPALVGTSPTESGSPGNPAEATGTSTGGTDVVHVADRVLPSTVTIAYRSNRSSGTGSGFVIDASGAILTNNHVVEGASGGELTVEFPDGERVSATVVGRSPSYDLAVIRVQPSSELVPVEFADSDQVRAGQSVVAVGAPLGLGGSVTAGIVSATDRPLSVGGSSGADDAVAYINGIQTDASINPGNSGGPLADSQGRIVGVNSAILTLGDRSATGGNIGLGFAIPMNQAREIADELIRDGRATYPVIGVTVRAAEAGGRGIVLTSVSPGGPAAQAGLRVGDVVVGVDGVPIYSETEFVVKLRTHRPGETTRLTVDGRGDVEVVLGSRVG